jgi:hypothetical protein
MLLPGESRFNSLTEVLEARPSASHSRWLQVFTSGLLVLALTERYHDLSVSPRLREAEIYASLTVAP